MIVLAIRRAHWLLISISMLVRPVDTGHRGIVWTANPERPTATYALLSDR
jgi:hypothetical protein